MFRRSLIPERALSAMVLSSRKFLGRVRELWTGAKVQREYCESYERSEAGSHNGATLLGLISGKEPLRNPTKAARAEDK
jgi:hypothetical protein